MEIFFFFFLQKVDVLNVITAKVVWITASKKITALKKLTLEQEKGSYLSTLIVRKMYFFKRVGVYYIIFSGPTC